MLESELLVNLNESCKIEDPSWIKPGESVPDWRVWDHVAPDRFAYGGNAASQKRMIDFSAENYIQNLLIDVDWYRAEITKNSDATSATEAIVIEECMVHADEKNISVILHLINVWAKKLDRKSVV